MKFATEFIRQYPPHLRHVATLPWEMMQIFSRYERKCKQIAFLKIASNFASRSPYWLQIKIFNSLLFCSFTFTINLWHRKFITADMTVISLNNQHGMKWREQDFDKTYLKSVWGKTRYFKHRKYQICGEQQS